MVGAGVFKGGGGRKDAVAVSDSMFLIEAERW